MAVAARLVGESSEGGERKSAVATANAGESDVVVATTEAAKADDAAAAAETAGGEVTSATTRATASAAALLVSAAAVSVGEGEAVDASTAEELQAFCAGFVAAAAGTCYLFPSA